MSNLSKKEATEKAYEFLDRSLPLKKPSTPDEIKVWRLKFYNFFVCIFLEDFNSFFDSFDIGNRI